MYSLPILIEAEVRVEGSCKCFESTLRFGRTAT